jgi:hypothetical protein
LVHFLTSELDRLFDLTSLSQKYTKIVSDYLRQFRLVRNWCYNLTIAEKDLADLAFAGLTPYLRDKLDGRSFLTLTNSYSVCCPKRIVLSLADSETMLTRIRKSTTLISWMRRPMRWRATRFV